MNLSLHNIMSKIRDKDAYFIVNLLSENADIVSKDEYDAIFQKKDFAPSELTSKGYYVSDDEERKIFSDKYNNFLEERNNDELQLFFVPGYTCNFNCSYCYQSDYSNETNPLSKNVIDAFFNYVNTTFKNRSKYVTLFGGEPLLPGFTYLQNIEYFMQRAKQSNLDVAIVTNGYYLTEYLPVLSKAKIREIQVTLDGTKEIHNKRRPLKGGGESFDKIAKAIDNAILKGFPINLRCVVDKENIANFHELAKFADERGWTDNPVFKTQIGRNYELHHCSSNSSQLYSRIGLYEDLYEEISKHPEILHFFKPAFSVARYLSENGELPLPLFDSCPACKTEWAFDYTGSIYSCTATVGKVDEKLGSFFPDVFLDETKISNWQCRDITTIAECGSCNLQLACGGGCGSVAKNKTGNILSPDCRPVKELLEMGISLYFKDL